MLVNVNYKQQQRTPTQTNHYLIFRNAYVLSPEIGRKLCLYHLPFHLSFKLTQCSQRSSEESATNVPANKTPINPQLNRPYIGMCSAESNYECLLGTTVRANDFLPAMQLLAEVHFSVRDLLVRIERHFALARSSRVNCAFRYKNINKPAISAAIVYCVVPVVNRITAAKQHQSAPGWQPVPTYSASVWFLPGDHPRPVPSA